MKSKTLTIHVGMHTYTVTPVDRNGLFPWERKKKMGKKYNESKR